MIILHLGFPKTGTTTLQRMFAANTENLRAAGICYPLLDDDFKQRYLKAFDHRKESKDAKAQENLAKSIFELERMVKSSNCETTILSCEELNSMATAMHRRENIVRLRDALKRIDSDVRLIAYVRNPADFYLSIAQEFLKRRGTFLSPEDFVPDFAGRLRIFEEVFEVDASVRELDREKLVEGDIVRDFLTTCGLARVDTSSWEKLNANQSLSSEVMFLLDVMRRTGGKADVKAVYSDRQQERLWRMVRNSSLLCGEGTTPILFHDAREAVLRNSAEDGIELKRRYGIEFVLGKNALDPKISPPDNLLSEVERIIPVDRLTALAIWAKFTETVFGKHC